MQVESANVGTSKLIARVVSNPFLLFVSIAGHQSPPGTPRAIFSAREVLVGPGYRWQTRCPGPRSPRSLARSLMVRE
jgi:hypothetical protein